MKALDRSKCEVRDGLIEAYLRSQGELAKLAEAARLAFEPKSSGEIKKAERAISKRLRALVDHCQEHGC